MQQPRTGTESFLSLERKLPILIGGLVAIVLLATLALVYVELRGSAVAYGTERLRGTADELADLAREGVEARVRLMSGVAADSAVTAFARGDAGARTGALARLTTIRVAVDSTLPLRIIALDGTTLIDVVPAQALSIEQAPFPPIETADSVLYSRLHERGGGLVYWTTAPIRDDGRIIGHVAQLRSIAAGSATARIEELVGNQTEIFFANREGGPWGAFHGGVVTDAPDIGTLGVPFVHTDAAGERKYAFAMDIGATPWIVVTQTPWSAVVGRSNDVLRRVAFIGLLLMLVGGVAAWLVSRSVTRPLRDLGDAADAIARGDYSRRTGLQRDDEIGRLASSFDAMAGHVDATHDELARRFAHVQALAGELETARVEALQANSAKSDFLATMSHEIRTPINAVIGYTDLLEAGVAGQLEPAQQAYVERIRLSSEHLITVVNDVLDFAKIESGQMRMAPEMHRAVDTIGGAIDILHARAVARGIDLHTECAAGLRYYGDDHRVQQVLLNLLSNALKFSPADERVSIRCDARTSRAHAASGAATPERQWTCITVADHGPGVPPDQLDHIFEPFIQGAAGYTRPHGGTGLGLAIARSLARMMGGDLTVESLPGAGASFTLWLPEHP